MPRVPETTPSTCHVSDVCESTVQVRRHLRPPGGEVVGKGYRDVCARHPSDHPVYLTNSEKFEATAIVAIVFSGGIGKSLCPSALLARGRTDLWFVVK